MHAELAADIPCLLPLPPFTPAAGCRCATWADRLHEDAFEEDLLGNLVKMTAARHHTHLTAAGSGTHNIAAGIRAVVQSPGPPQGVSAHTAASVMAAVTAVKASLLNAAVLPANGTEQTQQRSDSTKDTPVRLPHHNATSSPAPWVAARRLSFILRDQDAAAAAGSATGNAVPAAPSFLQALMAGGGVIHPPNGPPIPLNVDFGAEVALGRLLGRGGFGHVYEAAWRGSR
jgi:hypothetical protein